MSPYYKAIAAGRPTPARDWCGVFIGAHERVGERWRERAYAYNLYRDGAFSTQAAEVAIGGSRLESASPGGGNWQVTIAEPGLWRGRTRAWLHFTAPPSPPASPLTPNNGGTGGDGGAFSHTWVCVAPVCRVEGELALPTGRTVPFVGSGYHDHNFGRLPYADTAVWYWGRAALSGDDGAARTGVFYHREAPDAPAQSTLLLFGPEGEPLVGAATAACRPGPLRRSAYGLRHAERLTLSTDSAVMHAVLRGDRGTFSEGPFYRRFPLDLRVEAAAAMPAGAGQGIAEVFRPAGLLGPVASRALWSRLRRRR